MNKKLLVVTLGIIVINTIGMVENVSAAIAQRDNKDAYVELDYQLNASCFDRSNSYTCILPPPKPHRINSEEHQEEYQDIYELSQDVF